MSEWDWIAAYKSDLNGLERILSVYPPELMMSWHRTLVGVEGGWNQDLPSFAENRNSSDAWGGESKGSVKVAIYRSRVEEKPVGTTALG